jgi:hypothetical protein
MIDKTDPQNPVLWTGEAMFPASKDYMVLRGRTIPLPGVTVYAPMTEKFYVSQKGLRLARLFGRKRFGPTD